MAFSYEALAAEINSDPLAIGYKNPDTTWKGDGEIADLMNAANRTLSKTTVSAAQVRAATTFDAFDGLTAAEEAWFSWLTSGDEIAVTADTLRSLAAIGGASLWATADKAVMEPKMQALMQYTGSRAEELFGEGFSVSPSMVGQAANV